MQASRLVTPPPDPKGRGLGAGGRDIWSSQGSGEGGRRGHPFENDHSEEEGKRRNLEQVARDAPVDPPKTFRPPPPRHSRRPLRSLQTSPLAFSCAMAAAVPHPIPVPPVPLLPGPAGSATVRLAATAAALSEGALPIGIVTAEDGTQLHPFVHPSTGPQGAARWLHQRSQKPEKPLSRSAEIGAGRELSVPFCIYPLG